MTPGGTALGTRPPVKREMRFEAARGAMEEKPKRGFAAWPKEKLRALSRRAARRNHELGTANKFKPGNATARAGGAARQAKWSGCQHDNLRPAELTMEGTKPGDKRCHGCWKLIPRAEALRLQSRDG